MKNKFPLIAAVALAIGVCIGVFLPTSNSEAHNRQMQANIGNIKFAKLNYVLSMIQTLYVDSIKTDELTEKIIPFILEELDPHSTYVPKNDVEMANESLEGSFSGIGVQFNIQNDTIMVVDVITGGPSEKVGILPGDRIVMVNDTLFVGEGLNNNKVLKTLRGKKGSQVKVGIKRKTSQEILDFTITRGDIPVHSVDIGYVIADNIGYVKISSFGANTHKEFMQKMIMLKAAGCDKFIIDLRYNSGGYLHAAIQIINEFLKEDQLIVYTEGRNSPREDAIANGEGLFKNDKICILINEWSASASEIFAGAIQDQDRGTIIGRRSFGKGLVQQQITLPDSSEVRITIAHYYTPSGRSIQKPYEGGKIDEYNEDINNRYTHGEIFNSDSISTQDTIKYYTSTGRVVYGGGGITPDYFVPQDTTEYTKYFMEAQNKSLIYNFSFQYSDKHRTSLNKFSNYKDLNKYLDQKNINQEFYNYAESNGLSANTPGRKECSHMLNYLLKAYINRNILGEEAFYPILNENDETVTMALELMCKREQN